MTKKLDEAHTKDQLYTLASRHMAKFAKAKRADYNSHKAELHRKATHAARRLIDKLSASRKDNTKDLAIAESETEAPKNTNVQKYVDFITAQNSDKLKSGGVWGSKNPEVKVPEKEEEAEQLNEIGNTQKGQNTLKRYVLKAAGKLNLNARLAGFHNRAAYDGNQTDSGKENEKNYSRVANNRRMGIQKAILRLKEEKKLAEGRLVSRDKDGNYSNSQTGEKWHYDEKGKKIAGPKKPTKPKKEKK
jgi:hypothetical protein